MKDKQRKKKDLLPLTLTFLQQFEIHACDLLQQFLCLSKRAQAVLNLFLHLTGHRDLAYLPIPQADGENQNRAVALPLSLSQKRQPGLLQRTMRLNKEPGRIVEGSGIC